ncbi:MAG: uracil-DNA glycosylase [Immundisolibacter sp.]
MSAALHDPACRRCPRLTAFLDQVRDQRADYFAAPVPSFGAPQARLLVVGLAPGLHGANRTGRPFTGDFAGQLLYRGLYHAGLASAPQSLAADDGLTLTDCRITNAVKCVPPANKPTPAEIGACNAYLRAELDLLPAGGVVLALGHVAHQAVLRALGEKPARFAFGHGARHRLPGRRWLVDSYHTSRYNVQTGRIDQAMFDTVLSDARNLIDTVP